jgi:hypothetical protein
VGDQAALESLSGIGQREHLCDGRTQITTVIRSEYIGLGLL